MVAVVVVVAVVTATIVVRRATSRGIARKVVAEKIKCSATDAVALVTFPVSVHKLVKVLCVTSAKDTDTLPASVTHDVFA